MYRPTSYFCIVKIPKLFIFCRAQIQIDSNYVLTSSFYNQTRKDTTYTSHKLKTTTVLASVSIRTVCTSDDSDRQRHRVSVSGVSWRILIFDSNFINVAIYRLTLKSLYNYFTWIIEVWNVNVHNESRSSTLAAAIGYCHKKKIHKQINKCKTVWYTGCTPGNTSGVRLNSFSYLFCIIFYL